MQHEAVFSTACFPTVEYISQLVSFKVIMLEANEHFIKQTNRNRYHIAGPGGVQTLSIPMVHKNLYSLEMKDIRISYDVPWQRIHWRSITSAYNRSAFFEFYADDFREVLHSHDTTLSAFNERALNLILKLLKINVTVAYTKTYGQFVDSPVKDLRGISDRKNCEPAFNKEFKNYPQVFGNNTGFIKNLSILDLLFNTGPSAKDFL